VTVLGAEVEQLDALAGGFTAEGRRLDAAEAQITATLQTVVWIGPDADAFRTRWRRMAPTVRSIAATMRELADAVRAQAHQQRAASTDAGGVATPPVGLGPFPTPTEPPVPRRPIPPIPPVPPIPPIPPVPPLPRLPPIDLPPYDPRLPPVDPRPTPPPWPHPPGSRALPADRVLSAEVVEGTVTAGVGSVAGQAQVSYLVEHLANGQVRITELRSVQAGPSADAGAQVNVDAGRLEFNGGAMAGAAGLAGMQYGRTWQVPESERQQLLLAVGLEHVDPTGVGRHAAGTGAEVLDRLTPDHIGPINLPFDEANAAAHRLLDYDMPEPIRQELDVAGSADAFALLGLQYQASADAEAAGHISVGAFREADGDVGVRYSHEGALDAGADVPLATINGLFEPPEAGVQGSQSAEIVFGRDGLPKQLKLEQVAGSAEDQRMQTVLVDLDDPQMRADAAAIRDLITHPTHQNAARVAEIDVRDWVGHVEYQQARLSISGDDYGGGAGVGIDPLEGSGHVSVDVRHIDYDYPGDPE
jgi:hypothetical protein